jgi:hypothetical protein
VTELRQFGTVEGPAHRRSNRTRLALLGVGLMALLTGCASLPPGSEFPKTSSSALARPEQTRTEIGLIIESPELARQIALRFADITQPANSYVLVLSEADRFGQRHLVWRTLENGMRMDFDQEPNVTFWHRLQVDMLSTLPLDGLL